MTTISKHVVGEAEVVPDIAPDKGAAGVAPDHTCSRDEES
jgi:hypothetical protein